MKNIDNILGKRICNVNFITSEFDSGPIEIVKIIIDFGNHTLLLEIDSEFDVIIPSIIEKALHSSDKLTSVSNNAFKEYQSLLDSKLIWLWEMKNNQGYFDGIQMEFENNKTFQFLVEASYFRNSILQKIENTAANTTYM